MTRERALLLDVDGVLSDFFGSVCRVFGLRCPETELADLAPGPESWHLEKSLLKGQYTSDQFWKTIDEDGESFWSEMPMLPHAHGLYDVLLETAPVYFVTTPSKNPQCASGKLKWLRKMFPEPDCENYVLTRHKKLLANPDHLLIDDSDSNCEKFREAGGRAVVFPQQWNSMWQRRHYPLSYVVGEVEKWARGHSHV